MNKEEVQVSEDSTEPVQKKLTLMERVVAIAKTLPKKEDLEAEVSKDVPDTQEGGEDENPEPAEDASSVAAESDIEKDARTQGWLPKEEFRGDLKNWRSAAEYVARTPLNERLSAQNKEIKSLRRNFDTVTLLAKKQMEMMMQPLFEKLKDQKKTAIENGDVAAVEKYEADYHKTKTEFDTLMTKVNEDIVPVDNKIDETPYEVRDFIDRNKDWLNNSTAENSGMCGFAATFEQHLLNTQPNLSLQDRLNAVERAIKEQFSHKFENPNRKKPSAVESRTIPVKKGRNDIGFDDLPSDLKIVIRNMLKMDRKGKMTTEDYTKQLLETGVIKIE